MKQTFNADAYFWGGSAKSEEEKIEEIVKFWRHGTS